jgi:hypothetical protein
MVTAPTGYGVNDDTAILQRLINDAVGGGDILLSGKYRTTAPLLLNTDNVRLVGPATILRDFASGPTVCIGKPGAYRNTGNGVMGVTFLRTAVTLASSDVAHIKATACDVLYLDDIRGYDVIEGIHLYGGNSIWMDRINLSGDYSHGARFGIRASKVTTPDTAELVTSVSLSKAWISGPRVAGFAYPLWVEAAENWSVSDSYFGQGKFYSVRIEGADHIIDLRFDSTYVDAADKLSGAGDGVYLSGANIRNVKFSGCPIKGQDGDGRHGINAPSLIDGLVVDESCRIEGWVDTPIAYPGMVSAASQQDGLAWIGRSGVDRMPVILARPESAPVNYLEVINANAGSPVRVVGSGADVHVDIALQPKGSGRVWAGPYTTHADVAIVGCIELKDSTGVVRKVAVIA